MKTPIQLMCGVAIVIAASYWLFTDSTLSGFNTFTLYVLLIIGVFHVIEGVKWLT